MPEYIVNEVPNPGVWEGRGGGGRGREVGFTLTGALVLLCTLQKIIKISFLPLC